MMNDGKMSSLRATLDLYVFILEISTFSTVKEDLVISYLAQNKPAALSGGKTTAQFDYDN